MMSRRSIPDNRSAGRSEVVPFLAGEDASDRHARRHSVALEGEEGLRAWCEAWRVNFAVTNNGHHWRFNLPKGKVVEWWPSSAKLVVGQQWERGVHVHDYEQVKRIIAKELES